MARRPRDAGGDPARWRTRVRRLGWG